jgi:GxxExxY protein
MIRFQLPEESYTIRGAIYEVHRVLGCGYLESVYHEALTIEFMQRGIPFVTKAPIDINYKGVVLSRGFVADFICYSEVILEIKAVKTIEDIHKAQVINYLKATGCKVGFLVNFNNHPKVTIDRFVNGFPEVTTTDSGQDWN